MHTFLGIDGGASKTAFLLVDSERRELARVETGPSNYNVVGRTRSAEAIAAGFSTLPRIPDVVAAGFAGAGRPEGIAYYEDVLRSLAPGSRVFVGTDAQMAYYGAFGDRPGVVVIAGTGSILIGRLPDERMFRYGGWGAMFGDEGSGFWIGREAVRTALAFREDRRQSDFPDLVAGYLGMETITDAAPAWADGRLDIPRIAGLSRLLVERLPGEPGHGILQMAGHHLGRLIDRGVRRVGIPDCPVALVGGIGALPVVRSAAGCRFTAPEGSPLDGAVGWALNRLREGQPPAEPSPAEPPSLA
jgi:N-acetylglucosamine kinase-like BadF-type ATPase